MSPAFVRCPLSFQPPLHPCNPAGVLLHALPAILGAACGCLLHDDMQVTMVRPKVGFSIILTQPQAGIKTIPMEKKCKKATWLSEEALQIAVKKKRGEKQRRKGKI